MQKIAAGVVSSLLVKCNVVLLIIPLKRDDNGSTMSE